MSTRAELLLELKEWSDSAQKKFAEVCGLLPGVEDCVYADYHIKRLTAHRNTKLVVSTVSQLLERGESYEFTVNTCRHKAIAAFRAGETARGELWLDWSNKFTLNAPEEF
jgi:hypothetical protein